ncbi:uncharacterized protein LOC132167799 [Corylus avellana]|uniref:uncharacterized protein LOC132167799 n=1 Tax=Corylus avellana TaxID=13451 RepID=UPI00286C3D87|nr:uncharacterized protein LOC132167799 [Corylus avellana]
MVTGGLASRTRTSDRIRGIFRSTPTRAPVHIDLTEEVPAGTQPSRTGPRTRGGGTGWKAMGSGPRRAKMGRGFAIRGGGGRGGVGIDVAGRGGASIDVAGRGGAGRGGVGISVAGRSGAGRGGIAAPTTAAPPHADGTVAKSDNIAKLKGKRIATTVEKGIEIMEGKRKRLNPQWKP